MSEVEGEKRRVIPYQGKAKRKKKDRTFFPLSPCPECRTGYVGFKCMLIFLNGNCCYDLTLFILLFRSLLIAE